MPSLISCLSCPSCKHRLKNSGSELTCPNCSKGFPVVGEIPRFVPKENYAESFGLQWNQFANTQIDSKVGTNRSEIRSNGAALWPKLTLVSIWSLHSALRSGISCKCTTMSN